MCIEPGITRSQGKRPNYWAALPPAVHDQNVTKILLLSLNFYRVPLLKMMVEKGWCQLIPGLLHTTENDTREKVLQALHVMVAGCKSEFQKAHVQDNLNRLKLEWLKDAGKQQDYDDSEYVTILAQLVTDLMTKLR